MNVALKRLLSGIAGLAAILALGAAPTSAGPLSSGFLELNPAGANSPSGITPDSSAGTFTTNGGTGWAALGVTVNDVSNQTNGSSAYSVWGAVDIDKFLNTSFISGSHTCVGNDSPGCGWTFFATVHVSGNGTWNNGVFSSTSASTVTLDLWGLQGNVTNFGGANVSSSVSSLSDFFNLGLTEPPGGNVECYTSGGNVGTGGSNNCLQLAHTSASLAGSFFTVDDTANGGSPDSVTFDISTMFSTESFATGTNDFWVQPPDPSTFGLIVLSGCETVTATDIAISDGNDKTPASFFQTVSQQSGAAPCNTSSPGQENNHDPVGWAFATAPEPTSLALLGTALLGAGWAIRRRRRDDA